MGLFMLVEIILPGEVLPTDGAGEQLFPRVRYDVPHEVLLPAERFAAAGFVALERPQTDVGFEVLHEVFLPLERLGAHVTGGETDGGGGNGAGGA